MILLDLFLAYFKIGILSFGGGYAAVPHIQRMIVETNGWLKMDQFADLITIAEMTPGPILVNSATFVGQQIAGIPGALFCTLGAVMPSFIILLVLSWLYMKYRSLKPVQGVLAGLRPAIVAMIASAAMSLFLLAVFDSSLKTFVVSNFRVVEAVIFVCSLCLLRKFKTNPIIIIFSSGIVGTIIYLIISMLG